MGKTRWELSVLLCDNPTMRDLNSRYRDKDYSTDVLSFGQGDVPGSKAPRVAGDIVISMDKVAENARDFGVEEAEELKRLLVHGMLHLSGLDHEDGAEDCEMFRTQECLLRKVSGVRLF